MKLERAVEQKTHLASAYYKARRFQSLRQAAQEILAVDPEHQEALFYLGVAEVHLGEPEEARRILEGLATSDWAAAAFTQLGDMYFNKIKYRESAEFFSKALELEPEKGKRYAQLAMAQTYGRFPREVYEKNIDHGLSLAPDDPQVIQAAFLINHFAAPTTLQQEYYLERLQEVGFGPDWLLYFRGETADKKKDYGEAVEFFRQAYILSPLEPAFRSRLSRAETKLKKQHNKKRWMIIMIAAACVVLVIRIAGKLL